MCDLFFFPSFYTAESGAAWNNDVAKDEAHKQTEKRKNDDTRNE